MKYPDYLKCAKKHVKALEQFNTNSIVDQKILLELYYLSGYVFEGVIVYLSYKMNQWDVTKDLRVADPEFTSNTGLGYKDVKYPISGHNFQNMKVVISTNPQCENLPYVGVSGTVDADIKDLIDNWMPSVRYFTYDSMFGLSQDKVQRLISVCKTLVAGATAI